ncbi:hypothetical protein [Novosphingobium sediminis]|uniref:hypothetical protein n=1 Tax=Novosphingobium sediminis TaxID=707214 RepID=UPI0011BF9E22|nr:hypothetical protein [Novosphingobium sediminis]
MYWIRRLFSNPQAHARALAEVFIGVVFSILPFLIAAFVRSARSTDAISVNVDDLVSKGQMYLLAASLFGTVVWLAFARDDRPRHNARIVIGVIALICMFPIAGFIGVDPTFSTVFNPFWVKLSFGFYFLFIAFHYLLLFYCEISPPEPGEIFSRDTTTMAQKYEALSHDA